MDRHIKNKGVSDGAYYLDFWIDKHANSCVSWTQKHDTAKLQYIPVLHSIDLVQLSNRQTEQFAYCCPGRWAGIPKLRDYHDEGECSHASNWMMQQKHRLCDLPLHLWGLHQIFLSGLCLWASLSEVTTLSSKFLNLVVPDIIHNIRCQTNV